MDQTVFENVFKKERDKWKNLPSFASKKSERTSILIRGEIWFIIASCLTDHYADLASKQANLCNIPL